MLWTQLLKKRRKSKISTKYQYVVTYSNSKLIMLIQKDDNYICLWYEDLFLLEHMALWKYVALFFRCCSTLNKKIILRSGKEKIIFLIVWDFSKAETWQEARKADVQKKGFCLGDPQGFRTAKALSNCMQWTWAHCWSMCPLMKFWKHPILHLQVVLK